MYIPNILNIKNPIIILQNIFLPSYLTYQDLRLDRLVDRHQTIDLGAVCQFYAPCARLGGCHANGSYAHSRASYDPTLEIQP